MRLTLNKYHFHFTLGFSALCLTFFVLMCLLGMWQLQRYHFKKSLLDNYQQQQQQAPLSFAALNNVPQNDWALRAVTLQGQYQHGYSFYLQNKMHAGKVGCDIITPVSIAKTSPWLLVNRGWVPAPCNANLSVNKLPLAVSGYLVKPEYQFILGKNFLSDSPPWQVQRINFAEFSAHLHHAVYPWVLRLSKDSPNGFVRDWTLTVVPPSRHMGYAIQWFLMAGVLVIAYLLFSLDKKEQ